MGKLAIHATRTTSRSSWSFVWGSDMWLQPIPQFSVLRPNPPTRPIPVLVAILLLQHEDTMVPKRQGITAHIAHSCPSHTYSRPLVSHSFFADQSPTAPLPHGHAIHHPIQPAYQKKSSQSAFPRNEAFPEAEVGAVAGLTTCRLHRHQQHTHNTMKSYLSHELHLHLTQIALSALLAYFARLLPLKKARSIDQPSRISTTTAPPSAHPLQGLNHPDPFSHPLAPPSTTHPCVRLQEAPLARACRSDHNAVDICWSSSVTRSRGWQPRSSALLGH